MGTATRKGAAASDDAFLGTRASSSLDLLLGGGLLLGSEAPSWEYGSFLQVRLLLGSGLLCSPWLSALGSWLSALGSWLLALGSRLLALGS